MPKTLKHVNTAGKVIGWLLGGVIAACMWFFGLVIFGAVFRGMFEVAYLGWTVFGYF
jgi:hypothetical protein